MQSTKAFIEEQMEDDDIQYFITEKLDPDHPTYYKKEKEKTVKDESDKDRVERLLTAAARDQHTDLICSTYKRANRTVVEDILGEAKAKRLLDGYKYWGMKGTMSVQLKNQLTEAGVVWVTPEAANNSLRNLLKKQQQAVLNEIALSTAKALMTLNKQAAVQQPVRGKGHGGRGGRGGRGVRVPPGQWR